jgi:dienelactone hydrolase
MTRIALFHSVLGVRPGVLAAAEVFRDAGHQVRVIDQYDGRVFSDYEEASVFAQSIGYPALMSSALNAVADDDGPFVTAGFSNGAGMAEYVAAARGGRSGGVQGSLQFAGALPLELGGLTHWPSDTPVQLHYSVDDPFRNDGWMAPFGDQVRASGSVIETFLDYPGRGHLFTDASLPDEYDEASTALAFDRALEFLSRC